jgi:CheY-like chemotaxis protein
MKTKNITILAIDDSPDGQALIAKAFRLNGVTCHISWASSGEEAIAYLKGAPLLPNRAKNHEAARP